MAKIRIIPIIVGNLMIIISALLCICSSYQVYLVLPQNDFRAILTFVIAVVLFYLFNLIVFNAFLKLYPLKPGEIVADSSQEFVSNVHTCFYLMFFNSIFKNPLLPIFLKRPLYQLLGARLGENSYCDGIICDAQFVTVGKNSLLGQDCLLLPHVMEGARLAYYPIQIGDNVTIGARVIIHAGVTIGNNVILASGTIVPKNVKISDNEIWGGVPARLIQKRDEVRQDFDS